MQLPNDLVQSLQNLPGFNQSAFEDIHYVKKQVTSIRLNYWKSADVLASFKEAEIETSPVPWAANGYYLSQRPSFTFDPLFHAGCYYVQEASSMFVEQVLKQTIDLARPLKVLDLCAAPGGKATHIQSLISNNSLLVANEVIRQRVNILKDNIVKWGRGNVVVTNNDPKDFANLKGYFDVIVVDAPCSGSGLFRKDEDAVNEWSTNNVMLCSQRQQRILADVIPALKEGGILIYATCSYSKIENEDIANWIKDELKLDNLKIESNNWGITETVTSGGNYGYRFWPHKVNGEGFFIAAFQNKKGSISKLKTKTLTKAVTKQFAPIVSKWTNIKDHELIQINDKLYAWPAPFFIDIDLMLQNLRVIYSGIFLGALAHKKLIPEHALALSSILEQHIERASLNLEQAIKFLQKNILSIEPVKQGWQVATYKNHPLGWMNVLPQRINNYYPKELRILKQ